MAAVVGEALLSAFLQVLFDRMTSKDVLNFIGRKKLNNGLLKKLKIKLLSAESVLNDAEEKQMKNLAVRKWLAELKEVIDDADDLVDEINVEALRCEIEGGSGSTSYQEITGCFHAYDSRGTANCHISAAVWLDQSSFELFCHLPDFIMVISTTGRTLTYSALS
ncbi:putative disease resistance RPP13-like protein 1 [Ziziphus jujuba]|uniref:Disease resistance RPP13-like protein 1 n=1 Tax=Ziziphus jujuba TaxID=326968 RepID=A0ABM4A563_ZIZJJ|nr:putative disease resistance RPP13-like protein 1 [Ziziphus jujuba]